jgi:hypothetical protein
MPRYKYICETCNTVSVTFHGINETHVEICENTDECNTLMRKMFANDFITNINNKNTKTKIGQVTKEYIEKNKQILESQIKEATSQTYE